MAECERPFLQLPYSQIVAVVPVVSQRTVHGSITVIGTFPYDGNRPRKLEIHIGVIHPARSSVHRLTESLALDGLENVRQPVHAFFPQPVDQVLEAVAYLLPHLAQAFQSELHRQRKYINGRRSSHKHGISYGCDGGEHGSGGKQGLAHLPGLPLAGNRRYSHNVA